MGRIGSGLRLVSVFNINILWVLSYDVLRQQKTGVMTKGVVSGEGGLTSVSGVQRRARHKHFVVVLCKQWTMEAAVCSTLAAVRRGFIFHTSRLVYG